MSRWYVDTSAALKLLVEENGSAALARAVDEEAPDLVACLLLETELRRVVSRERRRPSSPMPWSECVQKVVLDLCKR